jgi:hypothetical protein
LCASCGSVSLGVWLGTSSKSVDVAGVPFAALELGVGVGTGLETGVGAAALELCVGLAIPDPKTKAHNSILESN